MSQASVLVKMCCAVLLLFAAGAFFLGHEAFSLPTVSAKDEALFQSWMKEFNKKYEPSEYERRLRIFLETKRMIDEHNAGNHSFTMGLSQFSDLTPDEFRNAHLMKKPVYGNDPRLEDLSQEDDSY